MQLFLHPEEPEKLKECKEELVKEFLETGKSVWKKKFITDSLYQMTNGKCIYCECFLGVESKYLEVEHFEYKVGYPEKVVTWNNLLPSCKRCNLSKSKHDVKLIPIINPSIVNPKDHLTFRCYRFIKKSEIGKNSIDVLNLNDSDRLIKPRFKVGNAALELLVQLVDDLEKLNENYFQNNVVNINKYKNKINALLKLGLKTEEYCTTISTVFNESEEFIKMKEIAELNSIWDDEMEERYNEIINNAYT